MASGPCGVPFREAFSCFHYSKAEPKGSDCFEPFKNMQQCMSQYPELYPSSKADDDDEKGQGDSVVGKGDVDLEDDLTGMPDTHQNEVAPEGEESWQNHGNCLICDLQSLGSKFQCCQIQRLVDINHAEMEFSLKKKIFFFGTQADDFLFDILCIHLTEKIQNNINSGIKVMYSKIRMLVVDI